MSITIQCKLKTVDFLDVTFDLDYNVYKLFYKENNKPICIIQHSNHLPSILKWTEKRISEMTFNKDLFDESIKRYKDTLKGSGFCKSLNYIAPTTNKEHKMESGK